MKAIIIPKTMKVIISIIIALFVFVIRAMAGAWNNTNKESWVWIALVIWLIITALWGWLAFYSGKI